MLSSIKEVRQDLKRNKMNTRFKQYKSTTPRKSESAPSNTPKGARSAPIPELTQEEATKLDIMLEALISLRGKKYSELSLDEKRLVEMFCVRSQVDHRGASIPKNPTDDFEIFTVIKASAYAHKFAVYSLQEYFPMPNFQDFHIYEDERMNIDDLYGEPYEYSGHPFLDALRSWPKKYLPVRASKGKSRLFALWCGRTQKNLEEYNFKERLSVTPNEALYQNPLLPEEDMPIEVKEKEPEVPPIILAWNLLQENGMTKPSAAAIYDIFVADKEAFKNKYGQYLNIDPEFEGYVNKIPRDTDDYAKCVDKYS